jgi:hypothetical protein
VSQDRKEDATMGNGGSQALDGLLAEVGEMLARTDAPPDWLVAEAKLSPEVAAIDAGYLTLIESEATAAAATRAGDRRTMAFGAAGCQVDVTVEEGADDVSLQGTVNGLEAVEVTFEGRRDARPAPVDARGRFTLARVPRGLGRLVISAADGRRHPTAWVMF